MITPVLADCGWCGLDGPEENGQYDLLDNPNCPVHAGGPPTEDDPR